MNISDAIQQIEAFLHGVNSSGASNRPKFVNVQNVDDLERVKGALQNDVLAASTLCKEDYMPLDVAVMNALHARHVPTLLTEWTSFGLLQGRQARRDSMAALMSQTFEAPLVVLCYQCGECLDDLVAQDVRRETQILRVQGRASLWPSIVFCSADGMAQLVKHSAWIGQNVILRGIQNVAEAIETHIEQRHSIDEQGQTVVTESTLPMSLLVETHYARSAFGHSMIEINAYDSPYKMLCAHDASANKLQESQGTDEHWGELLSKVLQAGSIQKVVYKDLGLMMSELDRLSDYANWTASKRWLHFIATKLYHSHKNEYFAIVASKTQKYEEFVKQIYRCLADISQNDPQFSHLYELRYKLLKEIGEFDREVKDYCAWIKQKRELSLYYLTDLTRVEKETCLELLDLYATDETKANRLKAIRICWPALADYLCDYGITPPSTYHGADLTRYFTNYKLAKIFNKVPDSFVDAVNEMAEHPAFYAFSSRNTRIDEICRGCDPARTCVWFVDALGVEFLAYLEYLLKAKENELQFTVTIHRANLPTTTDYNTEFREVFARHGIQVHNVKEIDELKHSKLIDDAYQKANYPAYFIDELAALDRLITNIHNDLVLKDIEKAVIVSDHGATRMPLIHRGARILAADGKGSHGGRICAYVAGDTLVSGAVRADDADSCVLATYDAFKGARRAEVEVHGGATLEEVLVPVIEINRPKRAIDYEISVCDDKIKVSARQPAVVKLFSKTKFQSLSMRLTDAKVAAVYPGSSSNQQEFVFNCTGITRAGTWNFDVLRDGVCIKSGLTFTTVNAGMTTNDDDFF